MSIKDKIVYYAYKYEGDWSKISLAIKSNEEVKEFIKEGNREDLLHFLASCLEEERYEWCQIINEYLICL